MNEFHGYYCRSGCGHTTIVNKYMKTKLLHCAYCGTKETLEYIGEFEVDKTRQPFLQLGLKPKTGVWLRSLSSFARGMAAEETLRAKKVKSAAAKAKAEGAKEVWEWIENAIDTRLRRMLN